RGGTPEAHTPCSDRETREAPHTLERGSPRELDVNSQSVVSPGIYSITDVRPRELARFHSSFTDGVLQLLSCFRNAPQDETAEDSGFDSNQKWTSFTERVKKSLY